MPSSGRRQKWKKKICNEGLCLKHNKNKSKLLIRESEEWKWGHREPEDDIKKYRMGKWKEQMIIGGWGEKSRWSYIIRGNDEGKRKSYKSDLIASIVSAEQTRCEDFKAFDLNWFCSQFPLCSFCLAHTEIHTRKCSTLDRSLLMTSKLLPLLCFHTVGN